MVNLIAVVVLAILVLLGWLIFRAAKHQVIKSHSLIYAVAVIAGIFTYVYFLTLDLPQLFKIVGSIIVGIVLIILAALYQRRRTSRS
jgi:hypothetical protein